MNKARHASWTQYQGANPCLNGVVCENTSDTWTVCWSDIDSSPVVSYMCKRITPHNAGPDSAEFIQSSFGKTAIERQGHEIISFLTDRPLSYVRTDQHIFLVNCNTNCLRMSYRHMCVWMCLPPWPFLYAVKQQHGTLAAAAAAALPHNTSCQTFPASLLMLACVWQLVFFSPFFLLSCWCKHIKPQYKTTHTICRQKSVSS